MRVGIFRNERERERLIGAISEGEREVKYRKDSHRSRLMRFHFTNNEFEEELYLHLL